MCSASTAIFTDARSRSRSTLYPRGEECDVVDALVAQMRDDERTRGRCWRCLKFLPSQRLRRGTIHRRVNGGRGNSRRVSTLHQLLLVPSPSLARREDCKLHFPQPPAKARIHGDASRQGLITDRPSSFAHRLSMKAELPQKSRDPCALGGEASTGSCARRARARQVHLPDGPPYANGDIHIGHALNHTLKTWSCHPDPAPARTRLTCPAGIATACRSSGRSRSSTARRSSTRTRCRSGIRAECAPIQHGSTVQRRAIEAARDQRRLA